MLCCAMTTALRTFLRGEWALAKRVEYERGGAYGTWRGLATFSSDEDDAEASSMLRYSEDGAFEFDARLGELVLANGVPLLYDCSTAPARVYFAEDPPKFFHELDLNPRHRPTSATFEHLCVADLYSGELRITSDDRFAIEWRVFGPTKHGTVRQEYTRRRPPPTIEAGILSQRLSRAATISASVSEGIETKRNSG